MHLGPFFALHLFVFAAHQRFTQTSGLVLPSPESRALHVHQTFKTIAVLRGFHFYFECRRLNFKKEHKPLLCVPGNKRTQM